MKFEACFYLDRLVSTDLIMAFSATFGGRLNGLLITGADLKTRTWAAKPERITQALDATDPPIHIMLFPKSTEKNGSDPDYYVQFAHWSSVSDDDDVFSLVAVAPAAEEPTLAPEWWNLAAEAGLEMGNGYLQGMPSTDISYGVLASSKPSTPDATWLHFNQTRQRYLKDPTSFHPVVQGKMLRNVLRYNFMPTSLAQTVAETLRQAGLPADGFTPYPRNRVVWTVPSPQAQHAAHDVLYRKGLVWEPVWIDLAGYRSE